MTRLHVIGPRDDAPKGALVINTTSRSPNWSKELSPFFAGPVKLWGGHTATNVENGWQYSKVYKEHAIGFLFNNIEPPADWLEWATAGWSKQRADRYPMGKGRKPEWLYWDGKTYPYVQARTKVYIPLYASALRKSEAFLRLQSEYESGKHEHLCLWDFDGYDYRKIGHRLIDVMADSDRKMGHAFVLAMMLKWGPTFYLK